MPPLQKWRGGFTGGDMKRLLVIIGLLVFGTKMAQCEPLDSRIESRAFWISAATLPFSVGMDIKTGLAARDRVIGARESNLFGSPVGQISTAFGSFMVGYWVHKYAPGKLKWFGTALISGSSTGHLVGAIHNHNLQGSRRDPALWSTAVGSSRTYGLKYQD
jgi:hypothetical protein